MQFASNFLPLLISQGRSHVFEMDMSASQGTPGMSPSHAPFGLPPYAVNDGSMSSSQSISSSNSGRDTETQEEAAEAFEGPAPGSGNCCVVWQPSTGH